MSYELFLSNQSICIPADTSYSLSHTTQHATKPRSAAICFLSEVLRDHREPLNCRKTEGSTAVFAPNDMSLALRQIRSLPALHVVLQRNRE